MEGWKENVVSIEGRNLNLMVEIIAEITGIPNEGLKFYRDCKASEMAIKKFPKSDKEKSAFAKGKVNGFFDPVIIKEV